MTHNPEPRGVRKSDERAKVWLKQYWWAVLLAVIVLGLLIAIGTDAVDFSGAREGGTD